MKQYFLTTLWRATLKVLTMVTLGVLYFLFMGTTHEPFVGALLLGAGLLWVIDGCDHGIDALRQRSNSNE